MLQAGFEFFREGGDAEQNKPGFTEIKERIKERAKGGIDEWAKTGKKGVQVLEEAGPEIVVRLGYTESDGELKPPGWIVQGCLAEIRIRCRAESLEEVVEALPRLG